MLIQLIFSILSGQATAAVLQPRFYRLLAPGQTSAEASYAFGTIHTRVHLDEFPAKVLDTLAHSRLLMTEVALSAEQIRDFHHDPYLVAERFYDFAGSGQPLSPTSRAALSRLGMSDEFMQHLGTGDCGVFNLIRQLRQDKPPLDFELIEAAHRSEVAVIGLDTPLLRQFRSESPDNGLCDLNLILAIFPVETIIAKLEDVDEVEKDYRSGSRHD